MNELNTTPNIADADGFYEELLAMHDRQNAASSRIINARLILLLANHIGDRAILSKAMQMAKINVK